MTFQAKLDPTIRTLGSETYEDLAFKAEGRKEWGPTVLIKEASVLLGHKTGITARLWYRLMPSYKAWRYAIDATACLARKPNYVYFLRSLKDAYFLTDKFVKMQGMVSDAVAAIQGRKPPPEEVILDPADQEFMQGHLFERECWGCSECAGPKSRIHSAKIAQASARFAPKPSPAPS